MDLDIVEFVWEPFRADDNAIDFDFEYDAPKYYDFTREESAFDAREAEFWFETALNYPPSPHILKCNWSADFPEEEENLSCIYLPCESTYPVYESIEHKGGYNHMARDTAKTKAKFLVKRPLCKHFNFMNPTASHLARQNYPSIVHCERLLRRFHKAEKVDWITSAIGAHFTKRQKLEAGYLLKVARLKHQTSFSHKEPKRDGNESKTEPGRLKVTIPKEPNLETACRAERYRSKINLESEENPKSSSRAFRARPLNRKILEAPLPLPAKSTRQQPEFKVFHFRTLERAVQHGLINVKSKSNETKNSTRGNLEEIPEAIAKSKSNCLNKKELNSANQRNPPSPPTESFSKLSLAPDVYSHGRHHPKLALANKENEPRSLRLKHEESKAKSVSRVGNRGQCGNMIRRYLQPDSNNQIAI